MTTKPTSEVWYVTHGPTTDIEAVRVIKVTPRTLLIPRRTGNLRVSRVGTSWGWHYHPTYEAAVRHRIGDVRKAINEAEATTAKLYALLDKLRATDLSTPPNPRRFK